MRSILSFCCALLLAGCLLKPVSDDLAALNKAVGETDFLLLAEGDTVTSVTRDFTVVTAVKDPSVSLKWEVSGSGVIFDKGKVRLSKTNQAQTAVLTATLTKNGSAQVVSFTVIIAKAQFHIPEVAEVVQFSEGDRADSVTGPITIHSVQPPETPDLVTSVSVNEQILKVEGDTVSFADSLFRNSRYETTLTLIYTSPTLPDETVSVPVSLVIPAKLPAGSEITPSFTIDGRTLSLTYFDEFDNEPQFKNDWDIGNPGYGVKGTLEDHNEGYYADYREVSGNGVGECELVQYPDGLKGYKNDRYKQPYWSPKAVTLKEGKLQIEVFWDTTIHTTEQKKGVSGVGSSKGYGLSGAIHSRRQFPCGLFITKMKHKKTSPSHWDAWWAESNNPFSKQCGKKALFMPTGADKRQKRGRVFDASFRVPAEDRGLNGEQVFEFDMYEWVNVDSTQWQVIHRWDWYGGYPGNEDRANNGDIQLWSTDDNLRSYHDPGFSGSYSDTDQAKNGTEFYLALLVTPEKIIMWNAKDFALSKITYKSEQPKQQGCLGNSNLPRVWNANKFAPIQVKYSTEIGQWDNNHKLLMDSSLKTDRNHKDYNKIDIMYSDFFAFYAWDPSSQWYNGVSDVKENF